MGESVKLLVFTYILLAIAIVAVIYILVRRHNKKKYESVLNDLEREKNLIVNANIITELSKVKAMINSQDIEDKYEEWKTRCESIKNEDVPALTDALIDVEDSFKSFKPKEIEPKLAKVELALYHVKTKANYLLDEIKELTESEERNREIVTKLKSDYRGLLNLYHENESIYKLVKVPIELQFETVDKLFSAFEIAMENRAYSEIAKIIKALDDSVKNLMVVEKEAPEIILLGSKVLPKKMMDVKKIENELLKQGFNLDYLQIDYNIEEAEKKIADIFDRLNVLNLEDSILELKTIDTYFDNIYNDFDKEKIARQTFTETGKIIATKVNTLLKTAKKLNENIFEIKEDYVLNDEDVKGLNILEISLRGISEDYDELIDEAQNSVDRFSHLSKKMNKLANRLAKVEENLDSILQLISNFKKDEKRAYEQLTEIKQMLAGSKEKINLYKLPVVPKNYYVELAEASEALDEMVKELEKKPLNIDVLNTRVDNARDLTLKLYKTTKDTIKMASMSENAIVYGNRYRSTNQRVAAGLKKAEECFYRGDFKASLTSALNALNIIEPGIHEKLLNESKN